MICLRFFLITLISSASFYCLLNFKLILVRISMASLLALLTAWLVFRWIIPLSWAFKMPCNTNLNPSMPLGLSLYKFLAKILSFVLKSSAVSGFGFKISSSFNVFCFLKNNGFSSNFRDMDYFGLFIDGRFTRLLFDLGKVCDSVFLVSMPPTVSERVF